MDKSFFTRLEDYYKKVAEVLRGEADAASVFPNPSDVGNSREKTYIQFLKQHVPSKCNAFLGGFLFDEGGNESKQMDVIITTDTTPRFNLGNIYENGKSFSPVEGTICVASIKSSLNKSDLFDALSNIASVPQTGDIKERVPFTIKIKGYDDWPYKIIYSTNGPKAETLAKNLDEFYFSHQDIPNTRKPDIIHVLGKYVAVRIKEGMTSINPKTGEIKDLNTGGFHITTAIPDLHGILMVLNFIQDYSSASTNIMFNYKWILNKTIENSME